MKGLRLSQSAVIINMLVALMNIVIAFFNLANGNINYMIFSLGCSIVNCMFANACAILSIER